MQSTDDLLLKPTLVVKNDEIATVIFTLKFEFNKSNSKFSKSVLNSKVKEIKKYKEKDGSISRLELGRADFKNVISNDLLIKISKVQLGIFAKEVTADKEEIISKPLLKPSSDSKAEENINNNELTLKMDTLKISEVGNPQVQKTLKLDEESKVNKKKIEEIK